MLRIEKIEVKKCFLKFLCREKKLHSVKKVFALPSVFSLPRVFGLALGKEGSLPSVFLCQEYFNLLSAKLSLSRVFYLAAKTRTLGIKATLFGIVSQSLFGMSWPVWSHMPLRQHLSF
jgi:hypothetical protein